MFKRKKPGAVFAHCIWADGSSYSKLIPALQAEGRDVIAQCGLDTLENHAAAAKSVLRSASGTTILVGHSSDGSLITIPGTVSGVAELVSIAALTPDADETSQSALATLLSPFAH